jgi:crotonobetainyl-CoA:carnitine CoA-transferase CaiB-like acyl-CoA transferase
MERPDLAADQRFATHAARKSHEDELDEEISAWTRERDPWQVTHVLQGRGVMAGVVADLEDLVVRDPHLPALHFQQLSRDDEEVVFTTHAQPARFDGETPPLKRAPYMGEHNEYVFKQLLGLSDDEFKQLLVDQVAF